MLAFLPTFCASYMASIETADTGKYLTLQKGCTEFDTDVGEVIMCVEHSVAESAQDNRISYQCAKRPSKLEV